MRFGGALLVGSGAAALMLGAGLWIRGSSPAKAPPPSPLRTPGLVREDPRVRSLLSDVESLRQMRGHGEIPLGGVGHVPYEETLGRIRTCDPRALAYLEEVAWNSFEDECLRVDLVGAIALQSGEDTRRFLAALLSDRSQRPRVRLAALEPLMAYKDAATFEVFHRAYLDPEPLEGRYLLCRALGESGRPEAVPLLFDALSASSPLEVRCHAASALGGFAEDPSVRMKLRTLALLDSEPYVRQNAVRALAHSQAREVEDDLRHISTAPALDPETRRVAASLLARREKTR